MNYHAVKRIPFFFKFTIRNKLATGFGYFAILGSLLHSGELYIVETISLKSFQNVSNSIMFVGRECAIGNRMYNAWTKKPPLGINAQLMTIALNLKFSLV